MTKNRKKIFKKNINNQNFFLKKIIDQSEIFLDRIKKKDFCKIDVFQKKREFLINRLKSLDLGKNENLYDTKNQENKKKELLIRKILMIDKKIIFLIKEEILNIKNYKEEFKKDNVNKFKSYWIKECGKEIDKKI